ncbi:hypothetical protein [Streptomyces sp. NPDC059994]|uniref:hypothetical protein n=1 Tax=Streptomyces sp. NPDC059994 TaxID=3347029 RepID=UPI00368D114D
MLTQSTARIRVTAALATLGLSLTVQAGSAFAASPVPDPEPVPAEVQHQRDLADGKLDPQHLTHKTEKEAQEARSGFARRPGTPLPVKQFAISGTTYYAAASTDVSTAQTNNLCAYGEHCLYYNSGLHNANFKRSQSTSTIDNYAGYTFPAGLPGGGQDVKNNAASVFNASGNYTFGVFYNSNHNGTREWFSASSGGDLTYVKNENASGKSVYAG